MKAEPVSYTIRDVPADLWRELKILAAKREVTLKALILESWRETVKRQDTRART